MTDRDEIVDLADRAPAMSEFEFAIEWGSLTAAEQDEFMALMCQRRAHGTEKLEAMEETTRALRALLVLNVERAPGMDLSEAIGSGRPPGDHRDDPRRGARPVAVGGGAGFLERRPRYRLLLPPAAPIR